MAPEMISAFLIVSCLELVAGGQSPTGSCLCGISAGAVFAARWPKLCVTDISCSDDAVTAACHFRDLCGAELSDKHLLGLGILVAVLAPSEKPQVCPQSTDCFLLASMSLYWCPSSSRAMLPHCPVIQSREAMPQASTFCTFSMVGHFHSCLRSVVVHQLAVGRHLQSQWVGMGLVCDIKELCNTLVALDHLVLLSVPRLIKCRHFPVTGISGLSSDT